MKLEKCWNSRLCSEHLNWNSVSNVCQENQTSFKIFFLEFLHVNDILCARAPLAYNLTEAVFSWLGKEYHGLLWYFKMCYPLLVFWIFLFMEMCVFFLTRAFLCDILLPRQSTCPTKLKQRAFKRIKWKESVTPESCDW